MKKFLLVAALFVMVAASATAQDTKMYAGGSLQFTTASADNSSSTAFTFAPEFGYNLNEKFAVGCELQFLSSSSKVLNTKSSLSYTYIYPYVRYNAIEFGVVSLFADGRVGLALGDREGFSVGVAPGMSIKLSDAFSFVSHLGFIGYRTKSFAGSNDSSSFSLGVYNSLSFGVYYNF